VKNTQNAPASTVNDEGKIFNMVALRKYQVDRLKYCYAVIECSSVKTAKSMTCDGVKFESSTNLIDLDIRMKWGEEEVRDVARLAPLF
jgi:hypothetical protein